MFDCHIHSRFSADSVMNATEACKKAVQAGLSGIAFTDHLDIDYPETDVFNKIDFEHYCRFMDDLKEKEKDRLKVLKGIEIGIQPNVIDESSKIVRSHDFDYVLASIHILDGIDPYKKVYYESKTKIEAYEKYLREILFMVRNFNDFDNVGHFEYIIRNACYDDRTMKYDDHIGVFDEIFKALINKGKGFEINTGSFRDKPGIVTAGYDIAVLKRYKELGGEIVSLGSDAHNTEYIGYKFGFFKDLLLEAGFRYETYFEKRKPVYIPLV